VTETTAPISSEQNKKTSKPGVANLFQTKWINANLVFFLYVALLGVLYIAYGHWTDKTNRSISGVQIELKDLQYQYKTVKSEVMKKSEEGEVVKAVSPLGLHISNEVPKRLQITQKN